MTFDTLNELTGVLAIGTVAGVAFVSFCIVVYLRYRERALTYPFYAARDLLIRSVAEGLIEEDSEVFQHFYKLSNRIIRIVDTEFFSLSYVLRVVADVRPEKSMRSGTQLLELVKSEHPQVQSAVHQLTEGMARVLLRRNLLLKILVVLLPVLVTAKGFRRLSNKGALLKTRSNYVEYQRLRRFDAAIKPA